MTDSDRPRQAANLNSLQTEDRPPVRPRLTTNYLFLTGGEFCAKVLTLAAFVYLGRIYGPERYGSLEFVLATILFFVLPVDFGLGIYAARELARNKEKGRALLQEVAALRLLLACCSFCVLLVVILLLPKTTEVKVVLFVYGLGLFAEPALLQWFFQGHDRMHWVAAVTFIRRGVFAICVLLFVQQATALPWIGVYECIAAFSAAGLCLLVLRFRLGIRFPRPWAQFKVIVHHLRQSAAIGLSEMAWVFLWFCPTVLMGLLYADEQLGWFGASHRIVMALHTFVWLYFFNLLPSLSRTMNQPRDVLDNMINQSLAITAWGGVTIACAVTLLAPVFFQLAYGEQFIGAEWSLGILVWIIPTALVSGHYRYMLIAYNHQQVEFCCTTAAALSCILLSLLLIPSWGAVGSAIALLAGNLIHFICAYVLAGSYIKTISFHRHLALPGLAASTTFGLFLFLEYVNKSELSIACALLVLLLFCGAWLYFKVLRLTQDRARKTFTSRAETVIAN